MECPYNDCNQNFNDNKKNFCTGCNRKIKYCNRCGKTYNRVYAVYCRNCGEKISDNEINWQMSRGGYSKTGISRYDIGFNINSLVDLKNQEITKFQLSGPCKSLLIYENYLFAISMKGDVQIYEILEKSLNKKIVFNLGESIFSEAAIADGSLYIGTKDYINAYSLCKLLSNNPSSEYRWQQEVTGTPIKSLIPVDDTLYFNLIFDDKHQEIHAITNISDNLPDLNVIHEGPYLSSIAANYNSKVQKVYFFSNTGPKNTLHVIDINNGYDDILDIPLKKPGTRFNDKIPVSVLGTKVFAVFEGKNELRQIDSNSGFVEKNLGPNTKDYAMASLDNPVIVDTKGLKFASSGYDIDLTIERQQVSGAPLILKNRGVVIGMRNGVVRIYDLENPAGTKKVWRISDNKPVFITSIVSSKNIIASGDQNGTVRISKLVSR